MSSPLQGFKSMAYRKEKSFSFTRNVSPVVHLSNLQQLWTADFKFVTLKNLVKIDLENQPIYPFSPSPRPTTGYLFQALFQCNKTKKQKKDFLGLYPDNIETRC